MNFNKYIEYLSTKIKVYFKENKYNKEGCNIKYILEKEKSDILIVIMSSCTRPGIKARYNYNRTLKNIKVNKLFILDDFGNDSRGSYYLGKKNMVNIEDCVRELIFKVKKELNIKRSIYVGSSKGGYAALYFGLDDDNSNIIIGAPQYYLGSYLEDRHPQVLEFIMGDTEEKGIVYLNNLLSNKILSNKYNGKVFIHYSTEEHTYEEHIKYMLNDLKENQVNININEGKYRCHADVSKYFPKYLIDSINSILNS